MNLETIAEILGRVESDLGEIKTQTQKTNGRVTDLEKWQIQHETELKLLKKGILYFVVPLLVIIAGSWIKTALGL